MKNINFYLLSFLLITILTACSKNTPEPPEPPEPSEEPMLTEATMKGKHTLSFLLDEEVWVSDRGLYDLSSSIAISSKRLAVTSRRKQNNISNILSFSLYLEEFEQNTYNLMENSLNKFSFSRSKSTNNCAFDYRISPLDSFNIVNITWIDNNNRHIAGTFQLRMLDQTEDCIDTIYITDGRFDLQFQTTP